MIINHNLPGANAISRMNANSANASNSMQKLSSGLRINKAGDDAAGLAISEKMRGQIRGLDQASANAQDGISMIQTAEGALNETHSILQRIRELADQSANGTNTDADRKSIQDEVTQLKSEVDRIGNTTEFNTQKLLNGSLQSDGAVTGTNSTNGAKVLKQDAAKLTGVTNLDAVDASGLTWTTKDVIKVDKAEISIDWDKALTADEKSLLKADYSTTNMTTDQKTQVKEIISRVVNDAISTYNSEKGANVASVNFYEAGGKLVAESGKPGQESQLDISGAAILSTFDDHATGTATGMDKVTANIAATDTIAFEINGVSLKTAALTAATANTTDATTVAADMQAKMRTAIDTYNTNAGLTKGQTGYIDSSTLFVNAKDGRMVATSTDGAVKFKEQEGFSTVKDLGLSQAQTEAAGNGGMTFQIGANKGQTLQFGINDMRSAALGIDGVDVSTKAGAQLALDTLDKAIASVSSERGKLGAVQNRLEHTINNLGTSSENLTSAESRIRDVDMAKEMSTFSKNNILSQAAQAMLAQANQQPQQVLQLLR